MNLNRSGWSALVMTVFCTSAHAGNPTSYSWPCIEQHMQSAPPSTTIAKLKALCAEDTASTVIPGELPPEPVSSAPPSNSLILARMQRERDAAKSRFSIIGHNRNYLLPVTYMANTNEAPFRSVAPPNGEGLELDNLEVKFQISLKTPLFNDLLLKNDGLYAGFTATSFWQMYNKNVSSPFRETNYEPELFWLAPFSWTPQGVDAMVLMLGFSHQSNGQTGTLSRSWNRLYADFIWEIGDFVFSLKPWYRLPESAKSYLGDSSGDDNPDIEDYMGHFAFGTAYRKNDHEFSMLVRNNLSAENKGAIQAEWTFPLLRNIRGYVQYFNGYGESLIDYNVRIERIGVGFLLTDLL